MSRKYGRKLSYWVICTVLRLENQRTINNSDSSKHGEKKNQSFVKNVH